MKQTPLLICFLISVASDLFGTDVREVLKHPERFENRRITIVGIARVPGYFYLCADEKAAADRHPSPALLVRKTGKMPEYREMDRQWVQVTGVVSQKYLRGWEAGDPWEMFDDEMKHQKAHPGILLEEVRELRDRPPPRIKDSTVWGVFKNSTNQPIAIQLVPRVVPGVSTVFFLAPRDTQATQMEEGRADALRLKGPRDLPLHEQQTGERIATGELTLRSLPRGWEYSRELSQDRTLYFRIVGDRIEPVPASEGRRWKVR